MSLAEPDPSRLYIARLLCSDGIVRHIVCKVQSVNEGAAYEYLDPHTGHVVGSVGRNHLSESTDPLDHWMEVMSR